MRGLFTLLLAGAALTHALTFEPRSKGDKDDHHSRGHRYGLSAGVSPTGVAPTGVLPTAPFPTGIIVTGVPSGAPFPTGFNPSTLLTYTRGPLPTSVPPAPIAPENPTEESWKEWWNEWTEWANEYVWYKKGGKGRGGDYDDDE